MKSKDLQPSLLYPARLSFKMEGEIKSFPDNRSLKEFISTKLALLEMLKGLLSEEEIEIERNTGIKEKMAMNKYLSIITNTNGLQAPNKRNRDTEHIRKHDTHMCCLQEPHLRMKDHCRLKVNVWKRLFQVNGHTERAGVARFYQIE